MSEAVVPTRRAWGSREAQRVGLLALGVVALFACDEARGQARLPGTLTVPKETVVEKIYDDGLVSGWQDYGWAPRELANGHPAELDFSNKGGWIIAKPKLTGRFGALLFKLKAPPDYGDFLEVRLDSNRADVFPRINLSPADRAELPDGWSQVRIPFARLNPEDLPFEHLVFRAHRSVGSDRVSLNQVGFTAEADVARADAQAATLVPARMTVDFRSKGTPISPLIYGIAYDVRLDAQDTFLWDLGATARRWGGNTASTYNWKLGHAWNTGNDWFFENLNLTGNADFSYEKFLDADLAAGVATALTVPIMGWVAKDTESVSFPVEIYGQQRNRDPYKPQAGDGFTTDGRSTEPGPQTRVGLKAPPEFVGEWVAKIKARDAERKTHSVQMYILDNEPMLWNSTHRDLHPAPVSYDELLDRTLSYAAAVRRADPDAVISGPALWGWPAYFYSAVDAVTHFKLNPDRLSHGNMPLLPWWLQKVHEHEQKTGTHLLDVVDVHYYPMADRVGGVQGGIDAKTSALRIRSTRSLWDSSYVDESWIQDSVKLIPRLKEWIDKYDPGLKISIGEWNFGAEAHLSGGLAVAEVLGRFGQAGIQSAFYWTYPPKDSPAFWAFRAYRNFDGHGGHFLEESLPTQAPEGTSLFASRSANGDRLVAIALNFKQDQRIDLTLDLGAATHLGAVRTFSLSRADPKLVETHGVQKVDSTLKAVLPPYSITVFDVPLGSDAAP